MAKKKTEKYKAKVLTKKEIEKGRSNAYKYLKFKNNG